MRPTEQATSTKARANRSTSGETVFVFAFFLFVSLNPTSSLPRLTSKPTLSSAPFPSKTNTTRSRLTTSKTFSEEEVSLFARLCGDGNPLHQGGRQLSGFSTSSSCSSSAPSPSSSSQVLVPGLLTASLFPGLIGTAVPGSVYLSQSLRFSAPLLAGEEVEVEVAGVSKWFLPFGRVFSSSSSSPSRSSSSSSSGLLLQMLQMQQKQQKQSREGERRGGAGGGGEGVVSTKKTREAAATGENGETLPTSFVRAKLGTRAWKSGSVVVVVEGEAEALWPVYSTL